jgi:nicotinamide mononucleotide transporter
MVIGDLIVTPLYAYRGLESCPQQFYNFKTISAYLEWKKILNSKQLTS